MFPYWPAIDQTWFIISNILSLNVCAHKASLLFLLSFNTCNIFKIEENYLMLRMHHIPKAMPKTSRILPVPFKIKFSG